LFDCNDYVVEAPTLEDAVALLEELQEEADVEGLSKPTPAIRALGHMSPEPERRSQVANLDPEEIVSGDTGITLIDKHGKRLRDLVSVPTGCERLGDPIDAEDTRAAAIRDATPPDFDLAAQHQREQEALTGREDDAGFV
jgi:hypothetical protein